MVDMHVSTKVDDQFKTNPSHSGVTFEGRPHLTLGGVGRNLASALGLLGHEPIFVTSLGRDNLAEFALAELSKFGLNGNNLHICWADTFDAQMDPLKALEGEGGKILERIPKVADLAAPTSINSSTCFALVLMDSISGQCEFVVANLEANKSISRAHMTDKLVESISRAPLVILDANLPNETIAYLLKHCSQNRVPIFMEPTDVVCLERLVGFLSQMDSRSRQSLAYLSPNIIEMAEILYHFEQKEQSNDACVTSSETKKAATRGHRERVDADKVTMEQVSEMASQLMNKYLLGLKCLLVTMDKRGVLVAIRATDVDLRDDIDQMHLGDLDGPFSVATKLCLKHYAAPRLVRSPVSVSGAGDSFASGFISGLLDNCILQECIQRGFQAAYLSLLDKDTIPIRLSELKSKRS